MNIHTHTIPIGITQTYNNSSFDEQFESNIYWIDARTYQYSNNQLVSSTLDDTTIASHIQPTLVLANQNRWRRQLVDGYFYGNSQTMTSEKFALLIGCAKSCAVVRWISLTMNTCEKTKGWLLIILSAPTPLACAGQSISHAVHRFVCLSATNSTDAAMSHFIVCVCLFSPCYLDFLIAAAHTPGEITQSVLVPGCSSLST